MRRQLAALVLALCLPSPGLAAQVVVQPGQTLSEIAARAGISTERLMQLNGIRDANKIVAGQRLTVPGGTQRGGGGNRGNGTTATPQGGRVTIRQGETLSEISERYGVSVERLMQLNRISDPTRVVAGDSLILRAPAPTRNGGGGPGRNGGGGTTVTVQPGDTLSEIADRYNISIERLIQLNRIQNPSQVIAGDKLVISTRPPARTTRPGTPGQTAGTRVHVVQPGDTLSEIASDYKVPVERLASLNNLKDPDELITGTRLRLTAPPPVPRTTTRPRSTTRPKPPATTSPTVAQTTPARPATTTPPKRPQTTATAPATSGAGTGATTATPTTASGTSAATSNGTTAGPSQATPAPATTTPAATSPSVATTKTTGTPALVSSTRTPTTTPTTVSASTSFLAALIVLAIPIFSRRSKMKGLNSSSAIFLGKPHWWSFNCGPTTITERPE